MPLVDLGPLADRVLPVLLFLVAITIVAEVAHLAGVFEVAGHWAARAGRHRTWALWLLIVALAVACTIVLSLDTTAVLLTPVVIAVARQVGVAELPFALTTVWLANTASLLLPVSNLTNLLALHHLEGRGEGLSGYLALSWAPALAAIAATVVVLAGWHRRDLAGGYRIAPPSAPHDVVLLRVTGGVCVLLGPAFVAGWPPAVPATVAAVIVVVVLAARDRRLLREVAVPWRMVLGVGVLFVLVDLAGRHGLTDLLTDAAGRGTAAGDLWRLTGLATVSANLVNNLPAYLALDPVAADSTVRLFAVLVGVNLGPMLTPWGSLATLLWMQRCRRAGLEVPWATFLLRSATCVLAAVAAATCALVLVAG